jgi:hypothetical protein
VKIHLPHDEVGADPKRWLLLHPAKEVVLVADQGIRVTCPAELHWPVAGVAPTIKLDELRVLVRPQVVDKRGSHVLEFGFEVEEADFHSLPEFIEGAAVKRVNAALSNSRLTWDFTETLTRTVALGDRFEPPLALRIGVAWGKHRIGGDAVTLVVSFDIGFTRKD